MQADKEPFIIGVVGDDFAIADPLPLVEAAICPGRRLPADVCIKAGYYGIGKRVIMAAMRNGIPVIISPAPDLTNAEDEKPIYDMNHRIAKSCDVLVVFKSARPAASTENIIRYAKKREIVVSFLRNFA